MTEEFDLEEMKLKRRLEYLNGRRELIGSNDMADYDPVLDSKLRILKAQYQDVADPDDFIGALIGLYATDRDDQ